MAKLIEIKEFTTSKICLNLYFQRMRSSLNIILSSLVTFLLVTLMMTNFISVRWRDKSIEEIDFIYPFLKSTFMPSLLILYCAISKKKLNVLVIAYYAAATIGDAFLLSFESIFVLIGGFGFLLSHILVSLIFMGDFSFKQISVKTLLLFLPVFTLHALILFPKVILSNSSLFDKLSCLAYSSVLEFAAFCSVARSQRRMIKDASFILCFIGYIFFIASDSMLLHKLITADESNIDVQCMSTYFIAQILITLGISL